MAFHPQPVLVALLALAAAAFAQPDVVWWGEHSLPTSGSGPDVLEETAGYVASEHTSWKNWTALATAVQSRNGRFNVGPSSQQAFETTDFGQQPHPRKQNFIFSVEENTELHIECSAFSVPRPFNRVIFKVGSDELGRVDSVEGGASQQPTFTISSPTGSSFVLKMLLRGNKREDRRGDGFSCVAIGVGLDNGGDDDDDDDDDTRTCGTVFQESRKDGKIIGGNEATPHEYPWMVTVLSQYEGGTSFCGGSLIAPNVIMTAAHCVDGSPSLVQTWVGCHSIANPQQDCAVITNAVAVTIHSNWDTNNIGAGNDIAFVRLSTNLEYNNRINEVCLPTEDVITPGYSMMTAGWGRTSPAAGSGSDVLKEASITSITDSQCGAASIVLCAFQDSGRTCSGDSGSFAGSLRNGRYEIDGVTSFVFGDCDEAPLGFAEVRAHLDLVNSVLSNWAI